MTELLYMTEFNVIECFATVVSVSHTTDERLDIILDQSCFYPRGGGQDWDTGVIEDEDSSFCVEEVRLDDSGIVHHIGRVVKGSITSGDAVKCMVDNDRRNINTRLHSAGHVIDMAVDALALDWVSGKGQHYPHLSAVEYTGTWDPEVVDELMQKIEAKANEYTKIGSQNSIEFMAVDDMHKVCKNVPVNIPTNKPARVVMYRVDFGIPCGGTHLKNIADIGYITIPKLKQKKGIIRLNYSVEGIN